MTADPYLPSSVAEVFAQVANRLREEPWRAGGRHTRYQILVQDGPEQGAWAIVLKGSGGGAGRGRIVDPPPDVTIAMSTADLLGLVSGQRSAVVLFLSGRLKVTGEVALATKLGEVLR